MDSSEEAGTPSPQPPTAAGSDSERREYFRVEDMAVLRYRTVSPEAAATMPAESHFDDGEVFGLMRELRDIDREHHNVLRTISEQDRDLGQYLRAINRKLELIAGVLFTQEDQRGAPPPQQICLSEGGLSILVDPRLALGTVLALQLTLLPEQTGIACYGEVIANRDEPPARTVIRFTHLREADRQLIARHIFQVQVNERRRQQGDAPG